MPGGYFKKRLKSFAYAFAGLRHVLHTQPNAKIHLLASVAVIAAGLYFALSASEWLWITLAIALVWTLESVNTAFEYLCDLVSPEHSSAVQHAKDIAAGAVLVSAAFAAVTAAVIFVPKILAALSL